MVIVFPSLQNSQLSELFFFWKGQYSPSGPWSLAKSTKTPPTGCKTTVHHICMNDHKAFFAFFHSHDVVLFCLGPHCLKGSLNKFCTISGIEIYWQNSSEPVCLPAQLRGSHCPECSEHMLLSRTACLTAKGWFNYINCLMTEERAAGPCMLVCDKRGTLRCHGPHYASNLENPGNCTQYKAYVPCFFWAGKLILRKKWCRQCEAGLTLWQRPMYCFKVGGVLTPGNISFLKSATHFHFALGGSRM